MRVTIEATKILCPILSFNMFMALQYFEDNKNELLRLERMRSAYDG